MALYVYEFLYRGRDPEDAGPAWHLALGQSGRDGFGHRLSNGPVMTMSQAADAGYDLPAVIADINAAALREIEKLNAQLGDLRQQLQQQGDQA